MAHSGGQRACGQCPPQPPSARDGARLQGSGSGAPEGEDSRDPDKSMEVHALRRGWKEAQTSRKDGRESRYRGSRGFRLEGVGLGGFGMWEFLENQGSYFGVLT